MVDILVTHKRPLGYDLLIGMDTIKEMGVVQIAPLNIVEFHHSKPLLHAVITIAEQAFSTKFDHAVNVWKGCQAPIVLHNTMGECPMSNLMQQEYKHELQVWLNKGWVTPYSEKEFGLAVVQENKGNVHPVMDYWKLNVDMLTMDADICSHKLREW